MDNIGELELEWTIGYNGGNAAYIQPGVLCYKCGNSVKFYGEGKQEAFPSPGEGVGPLAVHPNSPLFAFADIDTNPAIFVYEYPSMKLISTLKHGAALEILNVTFSHSNFLASASGVPNYKLVIWNYVTGTQLVKHSLSHSPLNCVTFNPANWRQICTSAKGELNLWSVEQCNTEYIIRKQHILLPPHDADLGPVGPDVGPEARLDAASRASSHLARSTVVVPHEAVAGLKRRHFEHFAAYEDMTQHATPVAHCWTPAGEVYVGCAAGQLLKVDCDTYRVTVLLNNLGPGVVKQASHISIDGVRTLLDAVAAATAVGGFDGCLGLLLLHSEALFAGGEDGVLRRLQAGRDGVAVTASRDFAAPITSLNFEPGFSRLAVGTAHGALYVVDSHLETCEMLFDVHHGDFVAVDLISPGSTHAVTLREDGKLQIWDLEAATLTSSLSLGVQVSSLACSPLSQMAVVGTASGQLWVLDVTRVDRPRVVHHKSLHRGPLSHVAFSQAGVVILTASTDGHVFVLDGRASAAWRMLGYTTVPASLASFSVHTSEKHYNITHVVLTAADDAKSGDGGGSGGGVASPRDAPAVTIIQFELPRDLLEDLESKFASMKGDFTDAVIKKTSCRMSVPFYGITLTDHQMAYTIAARTRRVQRVHLPRPQQQLRLTDSLNTISTDNAELTATDEFSGHELAGGLLKMSPHHKWLASGATDGRVILRVVKSPEQTIQVNAHDYRLGGVRCIAFTSDICRMLTTGYDGTLSCYKWKWAGLGESQAAKAVEALTAHHDRLMDLRNDERDILQRLPEQERPESSTQISVHVADDADAEGVAVGKTDSLDTDEDDAIFRAVHRDISANFTELEMREKEELAAESGQYANFKDTLSTEVHDMRHKLQTLMKENGDVPDIERLEHGEFELDTAEQTRLQALGDAQVQQIREQKEFDNLAKLYLTSLIRKECWDNMHVKGRGLLMFSRMLEVYNYPMRERGDAELTALEAVTEQRHVEMEEYTARLEIIETPSKSTVTSGSKKQRLTNRDDSGADEIGLDGDESEMDLKETQSVTGSLGSSFGGESSLLHSQFELFTRQQKMNQIVLLEDVIHRIQQTFNRAFDDVFEKKEQEIAKVKEKNRRIRKIMYDLGMAAEVDDPQMGPIEQPDMLLTVTDSEVTVEKYLSPEQQSAAEAAQQKDEDRRRREMGDNWRDRGLDYMMGGVLEMRKEDELKKDVPVPSFLTKPDEEWTDDEIKAAQEYEVKVAELEEEREKYKKLLEMELKKLQAFTTETMSAFDEAVLTLFRHKIRVEMCIYQEELKILRLRQSLLFEEEMSCQEEQLNEQIEYKRQHKAKSTLAVIEAKKSVDGFREHYEIHVAEDKVMEKAFKRELHDVNPAMLEQLYKLFRRRPRGQRVSRAPTFEGVSGDPFGDCPSSARQEEAATSALQHALAELDKPLNTPDGLPPDVWGRVCALRRQKIDSEHMVKQKALLLAEMMAFLQRSQDEDEQLRTDIEDLVTSYNRLKDDQTRSTINLEVQLVMKQGQVEADATPFIPNYTGCLLVHRSVVEDLNSKIRQLGERKINNMVESKDFRKGIIQLEWDHKRMTMENEDLENKIRDIQSMKVTREIQAYLYDPNHEAKRAQEIQTLELTSVKIKQQHERMVRERKTLTADYRKMTRDRHEENGQLTTDILDMNIAVNERRNIHHVTANRDSANEAATRYADIVQRSRLVEVAKQQAQEVAVLRAEVERLRMRTFPALVHVEH